MMEELNLNLFHKVKDVELYLSDSSKLTVFDLYHMILSVRVKLKLCSVLPAAVPPDAGGAVCGMPDARL